MAENNYRIGIILSLHDKMTAALAKIDGQARKVEATTKRLHKAAISPAVKINDHISQPLKTIEGKILNLGKTVEMSLGAGAGKTIFSAGTLGYYSSKKLVGIAADEAAEKQKVKSQDTTRKSLDKLAAAANSASNKLKSPASIETPLKATKYAAGGILTKPHLGLVGEDGPEAIIPLSAGRRSSAINLWQQAGQIMGVPMHAKGFAPKFNPRNNPGTTIFVSKLVEQAASDKLTKKEYDKYSRSLVAAYLTSSTLSELNNYGVFNNAAHKYAYSNLGEQVRRLHRVPYDQQSHYLATRTNLSKLGRWAGNVKTPANCAVELYDIYKAEDKDKLKATLQAVSGMYFCAIGEGLGFLIGEAIFPGGGGIVGAAVVGAAGYSAGRWFAGETYDIFAENASLKRERNKRETSFTNKEIQKSLMNKSLANDEISKMLGIKSYGAGEAAYPLEKYLSNKDKNIFTKSASRDQTLKELGIPYYDPITKKLIYNNGGAFLPDFSKKDYASGGLLTQPHLGLVAEAGPEVIIPLSSRMRSRSLELWQETGKRLGIKPYADGGFAGLINNTSAAPDAAPIRGKGQGGNINVTITGMEVNMTNDVDEDELALKIGRKILRSVKQAAENKAS